MSGRNEWGHMLPYTVYTQKSCVFSIILKFGGKWAVIALFLLSFAGFELCGIPSLTCGSKASEGKDCGVKLFLSWFGLVLSGIKKNNSDKANINKLSGNTNFLIKVFEK